jgi:phosphotriesterase-related protein
MKVMTVTGPADIEDLGIILPHEHLLMAFDWSGLWPDISHRPDLVWGKVSLENLGEVHRSYSAIRDNVVLHDIDEACFEVERFKRAGGGTIIEVSTYGLSGDPAGLKEISERTGVYVIAGTGFYIDQSLSARDKALGVDGMYDVIMRDLTVGFPGTGVKAGFLGEVATSNPMTRAEENSMRAAARAQKSTGVSMNIHVGANAAMCRKIIGIFNEEGVDLSKVVFAHFDSGSVEIFREMTNYGICCAIDCLGNEFYVDNGGFDGDNPYYFDLDNARVRKIKELVDNGLAGNIVLSQDVCMKIWRTQYGGYGYAHILENIMPMLEHIGVEKSVLNSIVRDNPKKFLYGSKGVAR